MRATLMRFVSRQKCTPLTDATVAATPADRSGALCDAGARVTAAAGGRAELQRATWHPSAPEGAWHPSASEGAWHPSAPEGAGRWDATLPPLRALRQGAELLWRPSGGGTADPLAPPQAVAAASAASLAAAPPASVLAAAPSACTAAEWTRCCPPPTPSACSCQATRALRSY